MNVQEQNAEEDLPLSQKLRAQLGLERAPSGSRAGIYDELRARLGLGEPGLVASARPKERGFRRRAERRLRQGGKVGRSGERNRGLIVLGLLGVAFMAAARYLDYRKNKSTPTL